MAVTAITDIIEPTSFLKYTIEKTKETSKFFQSGIITPDTVLAEKFAMGGSIVTLPYWDDLSASDSVISDDATSSITPSAITADKQVAVITRRAVSFASADLAGAVAGDDPMRVVGDRVAALWTRRMQSALLSTCKGILACSNTDSSPVTFKSVAVNDIVSDAATVPAASVFSFDAVVDAKYTAGDASDDMQIMVVHSKIYAFMLKNNDITFIPDSDNAAQIPTYFGMRVVACDAMPTGLSSTNDNPYSHIYIFAPGAIGYAETTPKVPVAIDRDELAGDGGGIEYFVARRQFCLHPYGFKWASPSIDTDVPDATDFEAGASWKWMWERKNIPFAALYCNY